MRYLATVIILLAVCAALSAQGIPVKSQLVRDKCGACHAIDSQQLMTRISYQRKTPEGWEETVRRMVQLHKVTLSSQEARDIVQYLSDQQGLTASEVDKISYALEQRQEPEPIPNEAVRQACGTCHSYARVAAQRRTKEEWLKLKSFLLAIIPTITYQHRYLDWTATADEALAYLAQQFPLETPEWQKEKSHTAPGNSTWLVHGYQPGKGEYVGELNLTAANDGSRQAQAKLEFVDGTTLTRTTSGRFYSAASWRGSAQWQSGGRSKEIYDLSPDGQTIRGRWLSVEQPGVSGDETLYLRNGQPRVVAVVPKALQTGAKDVQVKIYGSDFPSAIKRVDLNLGDGVQVDSIETAGTDRVIARVSIASDAKIGKRALKIGSASATDLLCVYDKVDYIRIVPDKIMARLGGLHYSKELVQFEARAYNRGLDGIQGNGDDLEIGVVKPKWAIEELYSSYEDKDREFVGTIDQNGMFTPTTEGPNPKRYRSAENTGEVYVTAEYKDGNEGKEMKARSYLLVSLPKMRDSLIP